MIEVTLSVLVKFMKRYRLISVYLNIKKWWEVKVYEITLDWLNSQSSFLCNTLVSVQNTLLPLINPCPAKNEVRIRRKLRNKQERLALYHQVHFILIYQLFNAHKLRQQPTINLFFPICKYPCNHEITKLRVEILLQCRTWASLLWCILKLRINNECPYDNYVQNLQLKLWNIGVPLEQHSYQPIQKQIGSPAEKDRFAMQKVNSLLGDVSAFSIPGYDFANNRYLPEDRRSVIICVSDFYLLARSMTDVQTSRYNLLKLAPSIRHYSA